MRNIALGAIASGVAMLVLGVYGVAVSDFSILLAYVGLLALAIGLGFLIAASRPFRFASPHPLAIIVSALALALHAYENIYDSSRPQFFWLAWSLVPYLLCLALSAFAATRVPVIAGAILALAFDLWTYYSVITSQSSTAVLAFLWGPIWNTIIVVPLATFVAWLITAPRMTPRGNG
jgi:sulfite exporter TauE/SafE